MQRIMRVFAHCAGGAQRNDPAPSLALLTFV
jgi:hypothetical protein